MANEFVARLGLIALDNSVISGSLTVTGGITGSFQGTASFATTASNILGGASNYIPLWNGATTLSSSVLYQSSGNIGIGTTSPSEKLDVSGFIRSTSGLKVTDGTIDFRFSWASGNAGFIGNLSNHPISFYTNAAERMRLTAGGDLGIGTTSPGATIEARTTATVNQQLVLSNGGTYHTGLIGTSTTTPLSDNNAWGLFGGPNDYLTRIANSLMLIGGSGVPGIGFRFTTSNLNITGGTTAMYISSSGNVGIGTTSPTQKLVISDNINGSVITWVQNENVSGYSVLRLGSTMQQTAAILRNGSSQTSYAGANSLNVYTLSTEPIGLVTNNILRMIVTSDGNVGIGTTSPSEKLHVVGNVLASGSAGEYPRFISTVGAKSWEIGYRSGTTNYEIREDGTTRLVIANGGNVGIGTTSPSIYSGWTGVDIRGTNGGHLIVGNTAATNRGEIFTDGNGFNISAQTNNALILKTNDTERMRISATGNIGIGTTSGITGKLTISSSLGDQIKLDRTGQTSRGIVISAADNLSIGTWVDPTQISITPSGSVGIGTTSPTVYSGYTTLALNNGTNGGVFDFMSNGTVIGTIYNSGTNFNIGTNTSAPFIFYTAGAERARITAAGNVGIGTTTPGYKLDVNSQSTGIAASFGAQISNTNFSGISFGYVEAANTLYRKSALVFERSETHGGGSNASGKIHFLLNNNGASSATALTDAVVTIDSVGTTVGSVRMGIGTRFPTASLHISGSVSTDNLVRVQSSTGAEYFFISGSGNVGIGTTTPVDKLEVEGNVRIRTGNSLTLRNATNDSTAAIYNAGGSAASNIYLAVGPSPTMTIGSNVGIGTTSPSTALHIARTAVLSPTIRLQTTDSTSNGTIQFANSSNSIIAFIGSNNNVSDGAGGLEFATGGTTTRMFISSSGNVGIGTSTPTARLDVLTTSTNGIDLRNAPTTLGDQTSKSSPRLRLVSSRYEGGNVDAPFSLQNVRTSSPTNDQRLAITNFGDTEVLSILNTGNVGIGTTSPAYRLDVSGSIGLAGSLFAQTSANYNILYSKTGGAAIYIGGSGDPATYNDNTTHHFRNIGGGTYYATINSTGIGVGTTAPNAAVTVVGSSGDTTSNRDIAVFAENSGIFVDDAGTTNSRLGLVKKAGFFPAIAAGSTTILSLGHWSTVNLLGNIRTGSFTADLSIATNGNVGIGTTSPTSNLQIGSTSTSGNRTLVLTDANYGLALAGGNGPSNNYIQSLGTAIPLYFLAGNANNANYIFSSTGRMGIGSTSPGGKVHIKQSASEIPLLIDSSAAVSGSFTQYLVNGSSGWEVGMAGSGDSYKWFFSYGTFSSTNSKFTITNTGDIGVGTIAPQYKLHVVGGHVKLPNNYKLYFGDVAEALGFSIGSDGASNNMAITNNNNATLQIGTAGTGGHIFFTPNSVESVRFTGTGNVGIGTTSPAVRLQVNGSTLITGSLTVGQSTTGSSEHTLTVGVPSAAGTGEGGQILLAASGGLYTSASMLDNYQNSFRILRGTNASSDAAFLNLNLHSGQLTFNKYTGSGAFSGTAAANLAVDSSGNVITVAAGGGGGSVTINNNTDNYLITATGTANTLNGEANLQFNGSALTVTGSLTVVTGSAIELQVTNTGVTIGSTFTDVHRITGSLNMPHTASGVIRIQDASVWANSANYINPQIRLPDYQTGMTLVNNDEIHLVSLGTAVMAAKLESGIPNVRFDNATVLKWSTAATNGFTYDVLLKRESAGVLALTGSLKISGDIIGAEPIPAGAKLYLFYNY